MNIRCHPMIDDIREKLTHWEIDLFERACSIGLNLLLIYYSTKQIQSVIHRKWAVFFNTTYIDDGFYDFYFSAVLVQRETNVIG